MGQRPRVSINASRVKILGKRHFILLANSTKNVVNEIDLLYQAEEEMLIEVLVEGGFGSAKPFTVGYAAWFLHFDIPLLFSSFFTFRLMVLDRIDINPHSLHSGR